MLSFNPLLYTILVVKCFMLNNQQLHGLYIKNDWFEVRLNSNPLLYTLFVISGCGSCLCTTT
jgi:hypothetical protein